MMRYRRNRASTMEGQQQGSSNGSAGGGLLPPQHQQQQHLPAQGMGYGVGAGVGGGAPWAMYQSNGGKPPVQGQMPVSAQYAALQRTTLH
jgi:hypothetical protein